MKNWIDISVPIAPEMAVWPGAPKTEFSWRRRLDQGDTSNNSNFFMNSHSGTHIDAPLHFLPQGKTVDQIPLDVFIGRAFVADLSEKREVTVSDLEAIWPSVQVERVLLKTSNSKQCQDPFCALREEETRWLLAKKIRLVGIDAPSIQRRGDSSIVHKLFLEAEVGIVEGLDLSRVVEGFYDLICLPLKLVGLEGAPARVLLRPL